MATETINRLIQLDSTASIKLLESFEQDTNDYIIVHNKYSTDMVIGNQLLSKHFKIDVD